MKLKGLRVKNYARFQEAYLPLDRVGITKIIGKNLDSNTKLVPAGDDTNAVGKTALVSGISQLAFASTPVTQGLSKAKKDAFKHKKSSILLEIEHQEKDYILEKCSKAKGVEYFIHKGTENTHVRTKKYPEEKIRKMFDMTEDEFYTLWSISSNRPSKLQYGTAATRFQFFTNFFKLNNHDDVRKIFNGMLRTAKESKAALNEILSQIQTLETTSEEALAKIDAKLSKYKKKAKKLTKQYSELHTKEIDLAFVRDSKPLMKKWASLTEGLDANDEKNIKKLLDKATSVIAQAKQNERYLVSVEAYKTSLNSYVEQKEKQKKVISEYKGKPPKNFGKEVKALEAELAQLKVITRNKLPSFDKALYKKKKAETRGFVKAELENERDTLRNKIAISKDTYRSLERLAEHSDCPTCKARIDVKLSQALITEHKGKADKYIKKLDSINQTLLAFDKLDELVNDKKKFEEHSIAISKEVKLQKQLRELMKWGPYFEAIESLAALEKPQKPKNPGDFNLSQEEVDKYKEIKSTAQLVLPIFSRYHSIEITESLDSIKEKINVINLEIKNVNKKIPKLTSSYDLALKANEDYVRLKERRKELTKEASDIEVLEMLVDAYSNKGIKLMLIRHIASVVEKNMNQYAPLVYPEPIKFKFQVVNDREFNILRECVTRKGKETDDVRVLSGAESRAFSFLLPLALMPLIPKERRLNTMILDEPTNNMGAARLELFVKNFIPKLNQIIPHIVIVSTSDEQYANMVTYQVTKKRGKSTLESV